MRGIDFDVFDRSVVLRVDAGLPCDHTVANEHGRAIGARLSQEASKLPAKTR